MKSIHNPMRTKYEIGYGSSSELITGMEKKQADILSNGIKKFILWLEDKNDDDRGYNNGFLTRFRHATWRGEKNLAEDLLRTLRPSHSYNLNPLLSLQNHFKKKLKLYNHSLDTYLLEAIYQNKNLFLITGEFDLKNKKERVTLRDLMLDKKIDDFYSALHAYEIARLYETNNNITEAYYFYSVALKLDCNLTGKNKALGFIKKLLIQKNDNKYLTFAFNLYSILALKNDDSAFNEMKLIANQFSGNTLQLGLVDFCINELHKHETGIKILRHMIENKVENAVEQMHYYVKVCYEYAFFAAMLCADSFKNIDDLDTACIYFAIAIQSTAQNQAAEKQLDELLCSNKVTTEFLILFSEKYFNGTDGILVNYTKSKKYLEMSRDRGCGSGQSHEITHSIELLLNNQCSRPL